jgi:ethanolamine-phosphate cytidylyltransferase
MLLMTKSHHECNSSQDLAEFKNYPEKNASPLTALSSFYASTKRIAQFCPNSREPLPSDKVIYVDGDFDLFHAGHASLLRKAKELGTYLVVGIHEDSEINRIKGSNFPVMNLHERVLGVLACKYVDEVVIGAPFTVGKDLMHNLFNVSLVVHGNTKILPDAQGNDPYAYPKAEGKFVQLSHEFDYLSLSTILERIVQRRQEYEERNSLKQAREIDFLSTQEAKKQK